MAPSVRPSTPSGLNLSVIGAGTVRASWSDRSENEDGFILQRSDLPVAGGTSTAAWPYKVGSGVTSYDISGLAAGKQVCVAVASFTRTSASEFTGWVCASIPTASGEVVATTLPSSVPSLSCDAEVASVSKGQAAISVNAGVANAGKVVQFEMYRSGKWYSLGSTRIGAGGIAIIQTDTQALNQRGTYAIRGTQGSRFICEGNLTILRNLKLKGALRLSNRN